MYYNLSKNVYRFAAGPDEGSFGVVSKFHLTHDHPEETDDDFDSIPWMNDLVSRVSMRSYIGFTPSFRTLMPMLGPSRLLVGGGALASIA